MSNPLFILKDETYQNGLFPQIPNYSKKDSWFLLTDGVADDIIVDDRTTVKQIRQGRYKRLVEISRSPRTHIHTFNSSCKETSYTFKVTVKAVVSVENPIDLYSNIRHINIEDFFNNQFSLDVRKITREFSILDYNGIDDALSGVLPLTKVLDPTTGLAYQISTVETQPNEAALKILERKEAVGIQNYLDEQEMMARTHLTMQAGKAAQLSKGKTYKDAIWEEVARGIITDTVAIQKVDDYNRQSHEEQFRRLLELRKEGFITDDDIAMQKQVLLPMGNQSGVKALPEANEDSGSTDEFFEEE